MQRLAKIGALLGVARALVAARGRGSVLAFWPARPGRSGTRREPCPPPGALGPSRVRLAAGSLLVLLLPAGAAGQQAVRLTLDEALARAEAASEPVAIAEAGVLRARGDRAQARSGFLPSVSATLGYTRTLESECEGLGGAAPDTGSSPFEGLELPFGQATGTTGGVGVADGVLGRAGAGAQPDRGRGAAERRDRGVAGAGAARAGRVTRAFYGASLSDRLVAIAEASLAQAEQTLAQVQAGQRVGDKAEFETLRAQVARDNQRPQVIQRRTERDLAYMRLKQLVNLGDADTVLLVPAADLSWMP